MFLRRFSVASADVIACSNFSRLLRVGLMTDELLFVVLFMCLLSFNQAIELKPLKNSSYWEVRFICTVLIGFHVKTNYLLNFVHT